MERKTGGSAHLKYYTSRISGSEAIESVTVERKTGGLAHLNYYTNRRTDFHPGGQTETCVARRKWRDDSEERRRRKEKRKKEKKIEWTGNV